MPLVSAKRNLSISEDSLNITPIKTGTIPKRLLTPCRRIGLCRKIVQTTPTITKISLENSSEIEQNSVAIAKSPVLVTNLKAKEEEKCSKSSKVKKSLKLGKKTTKNDSTNKTEEQVGKNICHIEPISNPKLLNIESGKRSVPNKNCSSLYVETSKPNTSSSTNVIENIESSNIIKSHKPPKRSFNRCLSMKKSSDDEASDLEESLINDTPAVLAKEVVINLPILELDDEDAGFNVVANKSSKRKIIYSSDEDVFVSSQNSSKENLDSNDLEKQIAEIKQRIATKNLHLDKLKQAAIYKKLHDIDKLNELADTWRTGCHNALRNLLVKLQAHGPIDMPTVLRNLSIPKELIDYNINDDCFI